MFLILRFENVRQKFTSQTNNVATVDRLNQSGGPINHLNIIGTSKQNIDSLVQDCSNSIANALELLESCTKPSIYKMAIFFFFVIWL